MGDGVAEVEGLVAARQAAGSQSAMGTLLRTAGYRGGRTVGWGGGTTGCSCTRHQCSTSHRGEVLGWLAGRHTGGWGWRRRGRGRGAGGCKRRRQWGSRAKQHNLLLASSHPPAGTQPPSPLHATSPSPGGGHHPTTAHSGSAEPPTGSESNACKGPSMRMQGWLGMERGGGGVGGGDRQRGMERIQGDGEGVSKK